MPEYSLRDDACLGSSVALGGAEGMWVKYWDEASTVAILEFEVEEPVKPTTAVPIVKEKKDKKKKGQFRPSTGSLVNVQVLIMPLDTQSLVAPSALPVSDKPVMLNFKGGLSINKPGPTGPVAKKPVPLSRAFSMDDAADLEDEAKTNDTTAAEDPKGLSRCWETSLYASWLTVCRLV